VIGSVGGPICPHLTAAALSNDPVTRMKHVMVSSVAFLYPLHNWGKPLNPILGETYQAYLPNGSMVYMEQVCHHPPVSFINFVGPNELFCFSGYSDFTVKASLNSINLEVGGTKQVSF